MVFVKDIQKVFEEFAPLSLQESYDNCGLLLGNSASELHKALLAIDITEFVVDEAIATGSNIIISHHPLIFKGLKKITGSNDVERAVLKAIKNDIAIYCVHTNLDNVFEGVNNKIAQKLNLKNCKILKPVESLLYKLITFVPQYSYNTVFDAICNAGAGKIGNYDSCTFNTQGTGTFRALDNAQPFVGSIGEVHKEPEVKIETIVPSYLLSKIIKVLLQVHPYEEVAYDVIPLKNAHPLIGAGMVGELEESLNTVQFLESIKTIFNVSVVKHSPIHKKQITRVALCGGAGSFLIQDAVRAEADVFITGDVKYHDFFLAENKIVIADIGHFESEQYTKEIFYEILKKNFPKFAVHLSTVSTNPIIYL